MKNVLMTACYKVKDYDYGESNTDDFEAIKRQCLMSYVKHLKDVDVVHVLREEVETYHEMFRDIFQKLKHYHRDKSCNILFVDADTLCVKETRIFGEYDKFTMFCIQDMFQKDYPVQVPLEMYKNLSPWFLSNVRYYPADMDLSLWETGARIAAQWIDVWAYECIVWNTMLHAQCRGLRHRKIKNRYHKPQYNYQYEIKNVKNGIPLKNAHIIHFHSSRDSAKTLETMRSFTT